MKGSRLSKNALLLYLDIQEPVLLGVSLKQLAQVVRRPSNLVTDLQEETLLVVHSQNLETDVLQQHQDREVVLDAETEWGRWYMVKFFEVGSSSSTPYSTTSA